MRLQPAPRLKHPRISKTVACLFVMLGTPKAAGQTADICATADDEADAIDARCQESNGSPASGPQAAEREERCKRAGLTELISRCHTPWVSIRLGYVERNLRNWSHAWSLFHDALATHCTTCEEARSDIERLMQTEIRPRIVLVSPRVDAPAARLFVNDVLVGRLPLPRPIPIDPGTVRLRVTSEGFNDARLTTQLGGGESFDESIPMVRFSPSMPSSGEPSGRRLAGYTLIAIGSLGVLAGAGLWIATALQQSAMMSATAGTPGDLGGYVRFGQSSTIDARRAGLSWEMQCDRATEASGTDADAARRVCSDARLTSRLYVPASWSAGGLGIALVAAGITLVVTSRRSSTMVPIATATVVAGYQGGSLLWTF